MWLRGVERKGGLLEGATMGREREGRFGSGWEGGMRWRRRRKQRRWLRGGAEGRRPGPFFVSGKERHTVLGEPDVEVRLFL